MDLPSSSPGQALDDSRARFRGQTSSEPFGLALLISLHHPIVDVGMKGYQRVVVIKVASLESTQVDIQVLFRVLAVRIQVHLRWVIEALRSTDPSLESGCLGGIERFREERSLSRRPCRLSMHATGVLVGIERLGRLCRVRNRVLRRKVIAKFSSPNMRWLIVASSLGVLQRCWWRLHLVSGTCKHSRWISQCSRRLPVTESGGWQ